MKTSSLLLLSLALCSIAGAANIVVTGTGDTAAVDGVVTLREAIASANANANINADVVAVGAYGNATITFAPGLAGQTIALSGVADSTLFPSALLVTSPIVIEGPGGSSGVTIARDNAVANLRLFLVGATGDLTVRNLTLSNGRAIGGAGGPGAGGGGGGGMGGAIFNLGIVRVEQTTLEGNQAIGGAGGSKFGGGFGGVGGGPNGGTGGIGLNGGHGGFGGGGGGGAADLASNGGNGGFGGGGGGAGGDPDEGAGHGGAGGFGGANGKDGQLETSGNGAGGGGAGYGGAIFNASGMVFLTNSTVSGNSAQGGAGGFGGFSTSGNGGAGFGAGIFNRNGTVTIASSTLSDNAVTGGPKGGDPFNASIIGPATACVYNLGDGATGTVTLSNTILANTTVSNTAVSAPDFEGATINSGAVTSSGSFNVVEANIGFSGSFIAADPMLGPLANNGGPTRTHMLLAGSVAIDAGNTALTTDQRGAARPIDFTNVPNASGGNGTDIGAAEFNTFAPSLVVTIVVDENNGTSDQNIGTGTSLREAISTANATGGTITFAIPDAQKVGGVWSINLTSALPDLAASMSIAGPGAKLLTVRRNTGGSYRIFNVPGSGLAITLSGMTVRDGLSAAGSGGIASASALTLMDCVVANNQGVLGGGVGLTGADGTFTGCTFADNTADQQGGGINFQGNGGRTLTLTQCTFSNNAANGSGYGGAIFNVSTAGSSTLRVVSCTVANNTSSSGTRAGGISALGLTGGTTATFLTHTIVAGNTLPNLAGGASSSFTSQGYNLASDGGGGVLNQPGDLINSNPLLGALQDNGGQTPTRALPAGSPAVNAGDPAFVPPPNNDQRGAGFPRWRGARRDIGAFEYQPAPAASPLVVTTVQDEDNGNSEPDAGGGTSLREAIHTANASASPGTITFNLPDAQKVGGVWTLAPAIALPDLTASMSIAGPGARLLAISGGNAFRVFNIPASSLLIAVSGITIRNGFTDLGFGGGIRCFSALTLTDCAISGNAGFLGGGVMLLSNGGSFSGCTFSGNVSASSGGGLNFQGTGGHTLTMVNCTFSGNEAGARGGGIAHSSSAGVSALRMTHCTVAGNIADTTGNAGGIDTSGNAGGSATTYLANTIVAQNTAPNLIIGGTGGVASLGGNLASDNGGGFLTQSADQTNTNPLLTVLQNNGGPTDTHALFAGSPAIDRALNAGILTDQRGRIRPVEDPAYPNASGGNASDIGAVEMNRLNGPDTNGNGLGDDFEIMFAITDPNADPDGDGMTNLAEFRAGTDPHDPTDRLLIILIAKTGSDAVITFRAVGGKPYRLERKTLLTDPMWLPIPGVLDLTPAANGPAQFTDPGGASMPQHFYRVRTLP